jgi:hypothetical protein
MIRSTKLLEELDARYRRERIGPLSYEQSLAIFAGLWEHAQLLRPGFATDWQTDIAPDIVLARVLNGLPVSP